MNIVKLFLVTILAGICFYGNAQNQILQNVTGTVTDADNKQPIIGALVEIENFEGKAVTDFNGKFNLKNVPIGRVSLFISSMGYEPVSLKQMLLGSTKEMVLYIELTEQMEQLNTIELTATENKGEVLNDMATLSAKQFTIEETKRFPGSFNDPARMVSAYAGVSTNAEGTNEIIVRGNSPKGILWRLEGIDIPNPNHFADEGTTGGPISILNVDMLDNSDFYTGAFPPQYGNALSGVFDISLRKGNSNNYEFSAGLGMLGVEGTAEGPLSTNGNSSFLVNYRYSSLALIDQLNIADFGGVPKYQDAAFNLNFKTDGGGNLSVFGLGGISHIEEKTYENEEEETGLIYKDDFGTSMGIVGIKHLQPINNKSYMVNSISVSGNTNSYLFDEKLNNNELQNTEDYKTTESFVKVTSTLHYKQNKYNRFQGGIIVTRNAYDLYSKYFDIDENLWVTDLDSKGHSYFAQAFGGWKHEFNQRLSLTTGIHATYLYLNNNFSIDPRVGLTYTLPHQQKIGFAAGLHSKLENIAVYLAETQDSNGVYSQANKNLELTKAAHLVMSYDKHFTSNLHFRGEIYYQYLYDVPVGVGENSVVNALNSTGGYADFNLVSQGNGKNYGIDLTFERYFDNDYYFLVSGSLYNSLYKNPGQAWSKGRFAGDYTFNAVAGKDFSIAKSKPGKRTLTISLKSTLMGGKRYTGILLEESRNEQSGVYDVDNPYGVKGEDVFILNLAATYRIDKKKVSHEIKVDIQNVTNNQVAVGQYYDSELGEVVSFYQLELFPVLSYKIYF